MLTLKKADNKWPRFGNKSLNSFPSQLSLSTTNQPVENSLKKEWLLTNERGSYASSTIVGCNTLSYHGLLIGSLNPPVNRIMALANCLEMVILKGQSFNLSTFEFNDKFAPTGYKYQKQFRQDLGVHFDYELENIKLTKSIYLLRNKDTVALVYDFIRVQEPIEFVLRPFISLRDFHSLQQSHAPLCSKSSTDSVLVRHDVPNSCELFLSCPSVNFVNDRQWWFNFIYRNNKERGQEFSEDLWTPGFFKHQIIPTTTDEEKPVRIVLWTTLSPFWSQNGKEELNGLDVEKIRKNLLRHQEIIKHKASSRRFTASAMTNQDEFLAQDESISQNNKNNHKTENNKSRHNLVIRRDEQRDEYFEALCLTADAFIVKRQTNNHQDSMDISWRTTIVAGYPWFADWGRDAFISLPGLLLSTGRFDEAKSVLTTFAAAADEGMIPNRFDDRSGTTYFNSVDASLWFINAAFQYLKTTDDSITFNQELLPTIRWIIDSYHNGTRFDIHADSDELITAGDQQTQLTWMDAKYEGAAFTPRGGKAVEVNTLWYNSLCLLAQHPLGPDTEKSEMSTNSQRDYKQMADKVRDSFCELFWNKNNGYLNDCILPDGTVDDSLRPNQIFAVSLPFSPLSASQQKSVVRAVQKHLLTPYGLRTLNVQNSRYKGIYTGPQQQRDEAYHQGTAWAFLLGPFVESFLKVNGFSRKSRKKAAEFIQPLLQHLYEDCCLGSVSEIFDGDKPHQPKGCFAQAWSVAELIRAYRLIYG